MGIRNSFKYREVKKRLEKIGCSFVNSPGGSHEVRYSPFTDRYFQVVNHGADEMREGTLKEMLKKAGISPADFLQVEKKKV